METQTVFEIKANLENLWKEFSENHAIYEEKGKIDFILIIGNGLSDEEMFVAAKKNLKYNSERFVIFFGFIFNLFIIVFF